MKALVTRRESIRHPGLFVKKYTKRVFFDNLWHEDNALLESRGHVETADGQIVIRPLTKIFNRFENGVDIDLNETCVHVQKINGFMAAVTWVDQVNDVVVSTTGSLDSDYVLLAEKYITEDIKNYIKAMRTVSPGTYVFEICAPDDPHIIVEKAGAYLLALRLHSEEGPYFTTWAEEIGLDIIAKMMGVSRPEWGYGKFSDVVEQTSKCQHEGFVVYGQTSKTVLKMKSPYYLFMKAAARRKDIMKLDKRRVDEEFYPVIDHIKSMGDRFMLMCEQDRLQFLRDWFYYESTETDIDNG